MISTLTWHKEQFNRFGLVVANELSHKHMTDEIHVISKTKLVKLFTQIIFFSRKRLNLLDCWTPNDSCHPKNSCHLLQKLQRTHKT